MSEKTAVGGGGASITWFGQNEGRGLDGIGGGKSHDFLGLGGNAGGGSGEGIRTHEVWRVPVPLCVRPGGWGKMGALRGLEGIRGEGGGVYHEV
jgi:hypothetical protein